MKKSEFIKKFSKIENTFEDEFRAEFNSPELIWEALKPHFKNNPAKYPEKKLLNINTNKNQKDKGMEELELTKGKRVTIPKRVKRYCVAYWTEGMGWQNNSNFHTTPESALEEFLRMYKGKDYAPKFYSAYELDLEIPIIK